MITKTEPASGDLLRGNGEGLAPAPATNTTEGPDLTGAMVANLLKTQTIEKVVAAYVTGRRSQYASQIETLERQIATVSHGLRGHLKDAVDGLKAAEAALASDVLDAVALGIVIAAKAAHPALKLSLTRQAEPVGAAAPGTTPAVPEFPGKYAKIMDEELRAVVKWAGQQEDIDTTDLEAIARDVKLDTEHFKKVWNKSKQLKLIAGGGKGIKTARITAAGKKWLTEK